jgi:hypothetical protein
LLAYVFIAILNANLIIPFLLLGGKLANSILTTPLHVKWPTLKL